MRKGSEKNGAKQIIRKLKKGEELPSLPTCAEILEGMMKYKEEGRIKLENKWEYKNKRRKIK